MITKDASVNVEAKDTFKYDYFSGFLLCLKMHNLNTI